MDLSIHASFLPHDDPPVATPGVTDEERRTILEMMAKGTYASINLATADLDGTFERLLARGSRAALSAPAIAAMTCTEGTVKGLRRDLSSV